MPSRRSAVKPRRGWKIQIAHSFEEAEAQTRAYWKQASVEERFAALEKLRIIAYGKAAATGRLQRFLEVVPGP